MPIRPEFRDLYPADWPQLSRDIRFRRDAGCCRHCGRPHGGVILCLPDGRWFDPAQNTWRDAKGRLARWPDLLEAIPRRTTRVVLAAAHLDHNPANSRRRNLRSLCQRCHLQHDRPQHRRQRWITYRRRYALGDLFLGAYADLSRALAGA
jgi:5-methylcytosine-specific restriction endonuclease McrA